MNQNNPEFGKVCEHGSLKRQCEICHRDEEISQLRKDLEKKHEQLNSLWEAFENIKIEVVTPEEKTWAQRLLAIDDIIEKLLREHADE